MNNPKDVYLNDGVTRAGITSRDEGSGVRSLDVNVRGAVDTELPAAVELADAQANPTVPKVGSQLMIFNGTTWDRVRGSIADGILVNTELPAAATFADDTTNPTAPAVGSFLHVWDGSTWDRAPGNTLGTIIQGVALDNGAATGRTLRNGAVFNSSDQTYGDGDQADLQADSQGSLRTSVRRKVFTTELSDIEDTYDNVTTTNTSDGMDLRLFRNALFYFKLTKANTPTDVRFELQFSPDDTNYYPYRRWFWANYKFDDVVIGSGGIDESVDIDLVGSFIKMKVVATGTSATNTITVADAFLEALA